MDTGAPGFGFDIGELGRYLAREVPGFGSLVHVAKFAAGQSNPTYRLDASGGSFVLRAKPPGELLKSAHQVDREFRVMAALAETPVPVPRVFHLASDDDSPIGRAFFVMEFLDGRIFFDPAVPQARDRAERAAIYDAMNAVLADLHGVDVSAVGLADYGRPGNYFARQLSRWAEQYRLSEIEPNADMARLRDWLEANLPADDGAVSLVHGDFRIDNMIFDPEAPKILALLDWELSTLGHPFADLAYQCMQWRLPNEGAFRGLGGLDREALGIPTEAAYVARYCERRGLEGIGDWTFHLAFSFFRLAAILQGVYKRFTLGNASNPALAQVYGRSVPLLARMANETIDAGR
ncbi:phosphotransferase [Aurantimonas sp. Leaf443]|uniref:phosphotransferase n=1 Tax=Aurantimonas sp. Leaf443 TaxID=1736378 RepID=UPI0006FBE51C|nr:phosphotransferase [Aurantimonas sp. Leaf443]KQT85742.1 aminoglycoside phosphotransferase [Aurantimonas sp. Leaf443]